MELNKVSMWIVNNIGQQDAVDGDGNYTGELTTAYSTPTRIRLPLYPYLGDVHNELFGKDVDCDMITVSEVKIPVDSLLFYNMPLSNYFESYDYVVVSVKESLNVNRYALRKKK